MSKLAELISLCRYGIHVAVNEHRDFFSSVAAYLEWYTDGSESRIPVEVAEEMARLDRVVCVRFFADSLTVSGAVFHHDVDAAVDLAIAAVKKKLERAGS